VIGAENTLQASQRLLEEVDGLVGPPSLPLGEGEVVPRGQRVGAGPTEDTLTIGENLLVLPPRSTPSFRPLVSGASAPLFRRRE
jgi:hypothetical protein